MNTWLQLSFELFLGDFFKDQNYDVTVTPASGDKGADVIIEKNGNRIAIQAKLYKIKVDQSAVVEVLGSLKVYGCCKGIVITNSYFQKSAIDIALVNNIELWDRDRLGSELANRRLQKHKT